MFDLIPLKPHPTRRTPLLPKPKTRPVPKYHYVLLFLLHLLPLTSIALQLVSLRRPNSRFHHLLYAPKSSKTLGALFKYHFVYASYSCLFLTGLCFYHGYYITAPISAQYYRRRAIRNRIIWFLYAIVWIVLSYYTSPPAFPDGSSYQRSAWARECSLPKHGSFGTGIEVSYSGVVVTEAVPFDVSRTPGEIAGWWKGPQKSWDKIGNWSLVLGETEGSFTQREKAVQNLWVEFNPQVPSEYEEDMANIAIYRAEVKVKNSAHPNEKSAEKKVTVKGTIEDGSKVGLGGGVVWPDLNPPMVQRGEKADRRILEKAGEERVVLKRVWDYGSGTRLIGVRRWCAKWTMEQLKENPEDLLDLMVTLGWEDGVGKVLIHLDEAD